MESDFDKIGTAQKLNEFTVKMNERLTELKAQDKELRADIEVMAPAITRLLDTINAYKLSYGSTPEARMFMIALADASYEDIATLVREFDTFEKRLRDTRQAVSEFRNFAGRLGSYRPGGSEFPVNPLKRDGAGRNPPVDLKEIKNLPDLTAPAKQAAEAECKGE